MKNEWALSSQMIKVSSLHIYGGGHLGFWTNLIFDGDLSDADMQPRTTMDVSRSRSQRAHISWVRLPGSRWHGRSSLDEIIWRLFSWPAGVLCCGVCTLQPRVSILKPPEEEDLVSWTSSPQVRRVPPAGATMKLLMRRQRGNKELNGCGVWGSRARRFNPHPVTFDLLNEPVSTTDSCQNQRTKTKTTRQKIFWKLFTGCFLLLHKTCRFLEMFFF